MAEPKQATAPAGALSAFIRGCVEPSRLSLGLALALTLFTYLGVALALTPERYARLAGWFANGRRDDFAFVSALAIGQRNQLKPAAIVFIGSSGLMESVDTARIRELLPCGAERLKVMTLATRGQTMTESAELLDTLDGFERGILVLGLGPKRIAVTKEEAGASKLALLMPGVREGAPFFDDSTPRSGNYFWDNRSFFLARLPYVAARVASGRRATFVTTSFIGRTGSQREDDIGQDRLDGFDLWWSQQARGFEILARVQQGLGTRPDLRVVYLTAPHNDGFFKDPKRANVFDDYTARMRAFAETHQVPFWDLDREAKLQPSDFFDYSHLKSRSARERYTEVLAERLRPLLPCR